MELFLISIMECMDKASEMTNICSICGNEFSEYPNNPYPLSKGICCDSCNEELVIQSRLIKMRENDEN